MAARKNICFITITPDTMHPLRLCEGIFTQCEKYGYNVAEFASMVIMNNFFTNFERGERNIYELIDFTKFDGVIVDTVNLIRDNTMELIENIYKKAKEANVPVVCVNSPYKDLDTVTCNNDILMRELCRHAIEKHGCKEICLLTGFKGNYEAEQRLSVMIDEINKHGLSVKEEHIIYGDFWYQSGIQLAQDIKNGVISKPDAVIASSDHMALGFIDEYIKLGGKIPDDICVLGFEANKEAALADVSLTSIESAFASCGAAAVDHLRRIIDPGKEILPFEKNINDMLHIGESCGCPPDIKRTKRSIQTLIYHRNRYYTEEVFKDNIDIGLLMESYIPEQLAASTDPEDCLVNILKAAYIIMPFDCFSLCLRDDWLDTKKDKTIGYPDKMRMVVRRSNIDDNSFAGTDKSVLFDTADMIPQMYEESDEPHAFYFSPIHFSEKSLGYAVLQRKLCDHSKYNLVYSNWLRFINNALEMTRTKERFVILSRQDKMTGLLNRRGMYEKLDELLSRLDDEHEIYVGVIDMDGLKYINDTFGHSEGDYGIKRVGEAALGITQEGDICARAGGDEFYIAGLRDKGSFDGDELTKRFCDKLSELTADDGKPFTVSASIGCTLGSGDVDFEELISEADENMYRFKIARKKHRR